MRRDRHQDRVEGVNGRFTISFDPGRLGRALLEGQRVFPRDVVGTIEPEHDPLRHLQPAEREAILSSIVPRKDFGDLPIRTGRLK